MDDPADRFAALIAGAMETVVNEALEGIFDGVMWSEDQKHRVIHGMADSAWAVLSNAIMAYAEGQVIGGLFP